MQAAAAALVRSRPELELEMAPIERLPDEVLELLFRLLDSKTLAMAIPAVSAWAHACGATPSCRPESARWAGVLHSVL